MYFRSGYGRDQADCESFQSGCSYDQSGSEAVWLSTCSGGSIQGSGYLTKIVNGKKITTLYELTGLVSAEQMILKYGSNTDILKKL